MSQTPEDRRPPLTPQLALRVTVVGSLALALFAIIFFRLWFLQVLSGDQYLKAATVNRVRDIAVPAARGEILDSGGRVLVDSRQSRAVQISPPDLPHSPRGRRIMYRRLAGVLGMSTRPARCKVPGVGVRHLATIPCDVAKQLAILPYANVTIKTDVRPAVQYYVAERQNQFQGVEVQQIYLRNYPLHGLAAQLFGTVGPINATEVKDKAYRGISQNSIIGQSGLEAAYDRYLRGRDGTDRVQVDALGRPTGDLRKSSPVAGHNLALSLNVGLQRVGQAALQQSIDSNYPANGGAFVALNPQDGSVYAMGSLPTFDPNQFTSNLSKAQYDKLVSKTNNYPLLNRAVDSAGPTGSTFKPITATAALQSGEWTTSDTYDDTGSFCTSPGVCRHNAGGGASGVVDLVNAIRYSSDTFFYNLGARTNIANPIAHPQGGPLQLWAHRYGIGQKTGIDLPGELRGTLPSPAWRSHRDKLELECEHATGPFKGHPKQASCGIADGRPWSIGDNINLAVGQGDVQVTPLQLAVVYSALANGGTVVRPHIGLSIQNAAGTVLQKVNPPPSRHIPIDPLYLETIRAGLRAAASQPGGTSADVFSNFPEQVYGKTGTAQYNGQQDYAWYACFVPASATTKPIVVVVTVEQGGFGAVGAAPVARQILSQWFFGKPGPYTAGNSKTL
ncbi:MAG TPA: penicillin-binding protein 2 [Solirubrobacteraceae bacterium]|jgi:penicillin-binding protein 2